MFRQDKRLRNRKDIPSACTMFTAVLFIAGGVVAVVVQRSFR